MFYNSEATAGERAQQLPFNPFKALVAPRPIGWITTISEEGIVNLAPYSYFQAVADNPDVLMFSATPTLSVKDGALGFGKDRKHSQTNAAIGGEFVCNLVSLPLAEAMNASSAHLPADVSEPEAVGIEMQPSEKVAPPRVALAPAAIECVVVDVHTVRQGTK